MSVVGEPTDELAREYVKLLKNGEGGVYLALTGLPTSALASRLNKLDIQHTITTGKNWDYITFQNNSSLAHIFFTDYHVMANDSKEMLTHENSASGIVAIWIEGDDKVRQLLEGLGLLPVRLRADNMLGAGQGYGTSAGNIIVIPEKNIDQRPRINAISIGKKDGTADLIIRY